uniref:MAM domain-containing protein n=1 Tax=Panagrellus redivivus TaxID=6233 RepID=A0A7E4V2Q2_PANRE
MMRLSCISALRRFCILIVFITLLQKSEACAQQYKKELRYLKFYLGIVPTKDDGKLPVRTNNNIRYIHSAKDLNCDFDKPCSWDNVPSDEHLDTSDFYMFEKEDKKVFPVQIQPGHEPPQGTHMLMAGNTTQTSESAVLVSSPIACQITKGKLSFKYWLYNAAKIEVVVLKINPAHNRFQVLYRPKSDCTFFKAPGSDCVVEIEEMHEPFKIGIRAHQLHDASVGSFAMITGIRYDAQICRENEIPSLFGGFPLSSGEPSIKEIETAKDLHCKENIAACAWTPSYGTDDAVTLRSLWQSGSNLRYWDEFVPSSSGDNHPEGNFIFQYIDPMSTAPIGKLKSALIPCTGGYSSLKLKYWMTPNVQAKLCTVSQNNVSLSCVFLQEENSPGPVIVDIDRGDKNPFRFVIEVIKFDSSRASIFAIDDIDFTGRLCHEQAPKTTAAPLGIEALFELQSFPQVPVDSLPESLDCNFEVEHCTHWENSEDGFQSAFVPAKLPFSMPKDMRGNAAVAHFTEPGSYVILQSPVIACAENARITVYYFSSIGARVSICADDKCLKEHEQDDAADNTDEASFGHAGELSVNVTSTNNFQLRIVAESVSEDSDFAESFVIVKYIKSEGHVCRLKDKTELACEALFCDFRRGNLCKYTAALTSPDDTPFEHDRRAGLRATLSTTGHRRVVLRSPEFELSQPADLRFHITLSTFGATAYICPDEFVDNLVEDCELLLGPKIDQKKWEMIQVQLDPEIQHFAIVAYHDKYQQFGEADVAISDISLVNADGTPLCVKL